MPDYQKSKIYKLWSDESDCIYIGATTQPLCDRLSQHKSRVNTGVRKTNIEMREHSNIRIELICNYPCNSKEELTAEEGRYIRMWKDEILNKRVAGRTSQERYEDNKKEITEKRKIHREENKVQLSEKRRENRDEKVRERERAYRHNNRDKCLKKRREYYEKNKKHIQQKAKELKEKKRENN